MNEYEEDTKITRCMTAKKEIGNLMTRDQKKIRGNVYRHTNK